MKKRGNTEKREKIQETLERYGRFDYDYIPFGRNWTIPDANYRYRQNVFHRALSAAIRCILVVATPLLLKIAYGARVTGRKNLKEIKRSGAICVTNHVSYLDTLFVRQAVGQFRSYHTMAPWNNKTGFLGWLIHHAGMLPFSSDLTATRN
ncbi:MAG: 1-acyl-sn-glycerol-3-phosphate acyltransferase, partial [Candidatus Gallimonas sp.]